MSRAASGAPPDFCRAARSRSALSLYDGVDNTFRAFSANSATCTFFFLPEASEVGSTISAAPCAATLLALLSRSE